jgi:hypothetical protein
MGKKKIKIANKMENENQLLKKKVKPLNEIKKI